MNVNVNNNIGEVFEEGNDSGTTNTPESSATGPVTEDSTHGLSGTASADGLQDVVPIPDSDRQGVMELQGENQTISSSAEVSGASSSEDNLVSLQRFFAKPRLIMSGAIATLEREEVDLMHYFKSLNVLSKLYNFAGLRFDLNLRLVTNVTQFDNGLLYLGYKPPQQIVDLHYQLPIDAENDVLQQIFAEFLPHINLDLAEESSAELCVPWWAPIRFMETTGLVTAGNLGSIVLSDFTVAGGSVVNNTAKYQVFVWLSNVDFIYPSNLALISNAPAFQKLRGIVSDEIVTQGPEPKGHQNGAVVLTTSRDLIEDIQHIPATAKPYCVNSVQKTPPGAHPDSFKPLFTTPTLLGVANIPVGDPDWKIDIRVRPYASATGFSAYPQYLRSAMVTEFFSFWKGSITFTLKFVKTKFHIGRIRVYYVPLLLNGVPDGLTGESYEMWSTVLDLRDSSEFQITVPYTSELLAATRQTILGSLRFHVLNPIQAPENCTQFVNARVYVSMNDDLEYMLPRIVGPSTAQADPDEVVTQGPINEKDIPLPTDYCNESSATISQYCGVGTPYPVKFAQWALHKYGEGGSAARHAWNSADLRILPSTSFSDTVHSFNKLRTVFVGAHTDIYTHGLGANVWNVPGGQKGYATSQVAAVLPYLSNVLWSGYFIWSNSEGGPKTSLGCLRNPTFYLPWFPCNCSQPSD